MVSQELYLEVAVWCPQNDDVAVRYVGFQSLRTGRYWIAFANYIALDGDGDISTEEVYAGGGVAEKVNEIPTQDIEWRDDLGSAVEFFIENNPS